MKLKRSRAARRGRIEIIPMIDVMFFLLATFMLASLSMQTLNSLKVNLPEGSAAPMNHREPVTLTVTREGGLLIDKTHVTLDTLAAVLAPRLAAGDHGVVVNADSAAPEGVVVRAMLRARAAGVDHFTIAVRRE